MRKMQKSMGYEPGDVYELQEWIEKAGSPPIGGVMPAIYRFEDIIEFPEEYAQFLVEVFGLEADLSEMASVVKNRGTDMMREMER